MISKPVTGRLAGSATPELHKPESMAKVEIYTSPYCGYCSAAKRLIKRKNVTFEEYDVLFDAEREREMLTRGNGRHTVPQIFINSVGIGGYDELRSLDAKGELDPLLDQP